MSDHPFPVVVGIDLGTTYSCIARVDERGNGKPEVIPNKEGSPTTPSVVFFEGDNRVIGAEAKNVALSQPSQIVEMVKRQMGRYVEGELPWRFSLDGKEYTPEEISSYILQKVVKDAEEYLGVPIKDVVITCPAYFGMSERDATARAGALAGLNVLSIINEPTAAAIAFGLLDNSDQVVLVYDLGGGTFDITMIEMKGGNLTVIATGGDHNLGGRQWDERLVQYLADCWKAESGSSDDPLDSPETQQDLFDRAERGKWALSTKDKTQIVVQHGGKRVSVTLTREKFDELTADLLNLTIEYSRTTLGEAIAKGYERFDQILLVGGSTRMRQVQDRVPAEFKVPARSFDPDQAVAKGAAVYALKLVLDREFEKRFGTLDGRAAPEAEKAREQMAVDLGVSPLLVKGYAATQIRNVTSRSFGVAAWRSQPGAPDIQVVNNLVVKQTRIPAECKQVFGTYAANQERADLEFFENLIAGPEATPAQSKKIGEAVLPLPPNLPKGAPIEVTFKINEQGRLVATALDVSTNRAIEVEIDTAAGMSEAEVAQAEERSTRISVS